MREETYLDIERRNKNKIIKEFQIQNRKLTLELSTLKSKLRKLCDST